MFFLSLVPETAPENVEVEYNTETRCLDVSWDSLLKPNGPITGELT